MKKKHNMYICEGAIMGMRSRPKKEAKPYVESGRLKHLGKHHYEVVGMGLEVIANDCRDFEEDGSWKVMKKGKAITCLDTVDTLDTLFLSIIDGGMLHLYGIPNPGSTVPPAAAIEGL